MLLTCGFHYFALLVAARSARADQRDDELFGTPDAEEEASAEEPAAEPQPTDAVLEEETDTSTMVDAIDLRDDSFTIGGRLWLQVQSTVPEGADEAADASLDAPNLLDLFADARPNDRVRAYARGRLQHDWTVRSDAVDPITGEPVPAQFVLLDQLWLKTDIARRVYLTLGRQRVKWGTGRFWNPSDFLNLQRLDPLAVQDLRTGVDLLRVHLPIESAGLNLYAAAVLPDAVAPDEIGAAARVEWLVGVTEVSASAALRQDTPERLGADVSSGLWVLDLHVETAIQHGGPPEWRGTFDPAALELPREVRRDGWYPQVVGGLELPVRLSTEDQITFGVEAFVNSLGEPDADLYEWLAVQGQLTPFYLGQRYGAAYVFLPGPGSWDDHSFTTSALANLSDGTAVARFDWRATVQTFLGINAFVQAHLGQQGEFHFGTRIPGVLLGRERDLVIPAPALVVGAGAQVSF